MGLRVEGLSEVKGPLLALGGLALGGGLVGTLSMIDYNHNVKNQLAQIQIEASLTHPDVSAVELKKATQIDITKATKPEVLQAKDTVDLHQAYRAEFQRLGGETVEARSVLDVTGAAIAIGGGGLCLLITLGGIAVRVKRTASRPTMLGV